MSLPAKTMIALVSLSTLGLIALTACGSSADREAAADSGENAAASSAASSTGSSAPVAAAAPTAPRAQWTLAGHAMTLSLRPGVGSGPVSSYEVRVAPQNKMPDDGREVETCPAKGADATSCVLAPLKRGDWDVWVRSVGTQPDQVSPWYRGAYGNVSSCTPADGLSGACEVFDKGPGGGFVFYNAGSRQPWGQYLEGAPGGWADSSGGQTSYPWCPDTDKNFSTQLGTSTAIGSGPANTTAIIAVCGANSAAGAARAYSGGGLHDWALASLDELDLMYDFRDELSMYGWNYWSSSQHDGFPYEAWRERFERTHNKTPELPRSSWTPRIWSDGPLRPIRAF